MSKNVRLATGIGFFLVLLILALAGTVLAQQGTPTPGAMMGATPGAMMGGTPMPGGMMGGTAMPGGMMGAQGMMGGTAMPGGMMGAQGMMGAEGMMGGMSGNGMMGGMSDNGMMGMMGMMMQHMQMMGGMSGNGMMGNDMLGGGMPGSGWVDPAARPLSIDQVISATQQYLISMPNSGGAGLTPLTIFEFSNGFSVAVGDKSGAAMELHVDRYTGQISPEPGPNQMWNTRYGMNANRNGLQGLWTPPGAGTTSVSLQTARSNAEQFLAVKFPGTTLAQEAFTFPGYYNFTFEKGGQTVGMLSVNATSGQVWYHTWHAQFLSKRTVSAASTGT